ncbi:PilX N-terminal domain-containing pilus assembly protein [Ectothiorhodospira lacustris]|uniref:PilX N-terminal domain-containing pilus assembly protein n=1 Tax=Ectothiorhodospira lacustris TaxID=2899127 RepID=UPI001EE78334|nr:PilX N-terminal domain-containing pilus assembly protein [Ectothiorhodospira lacustris]MCG5499675.1 PilX N-terminal domain-containing pilus assembly protein [Ectothiorhodospira lacustris]
MSISPVRERGAVLVVSLVLLVLATLVGVSGISTAVIQERIAGNHKQISDAFMAAEDGLGSVIKAVADPGPSGMEFWSSKEDMVQLIGAGRHYVGGADGPGAYWELDESASMIDGHQAEVVLIGRSSDSEIAAQRALVLQVSRWFDPSPDSAYTCIGAACEQDRVLPMRRYRTIQYDGRDWTPPSQVSCESGSCQAEISQEEGVGPMAGIHLMPQDAGDQAGSFELHDAEGEVIGSPQLRITSLPSSPNEGGVRSWQQYLQTLLAGSSDRIIHVDLGASADADSPALGEIIGTSEPGVYHITGSGSIGLSGDVHGAGVLIISGDPSSGASQQTVNLFPSSGSFTFEGLVILRDGVILNAEQADVSLYGAVVVMLGEHQGSGGGLVGNVDIRYSSKALANLTEHRLWDPVRPDFTWAWKEKMDLYALNEEAS